LIAFSFLPAPDCYDLGQFRAYQIAVLDLDQDLVAVESTGFTLFPQALRSRRRVPDPGVIDNRDIVWMIASHVNKGFTDRYRLHQLHDPISRHRRDRIPRDLSNQRQQASSTRKEYTVEYTGHIWTLPKDQEKFPASSKLIEEVVLLVLPCRH
jgi:hypothetical protein